MLFIRPGQSQLCFGQACAAVNDLIDGFNQVVVADDKGDRLVLLQVTK